MASLELLFYDGVRVPITVDQGLLAATGSGHSVERFRVRELVEHLYRSWDELVGARTSIEAPQSTAQIQMIHLGAVVDPGRAVAALDLATSPVVHVTVKPLEMMRDNSQGGAGAGKKAFFQRFRAGSQAREPVEREGTQAAGAGAPPGPQAVAGGSVAAAATSPGAENADPETQDVSRASTSTNKAAEFDTQPGNRRIDAAPAAPPPPTGNTTAAAAPSAGCCVIS